MPPGPSHRLLSSGLTISSAAHGPEQIKSDNDGQSYDDVTSGYNTGCLMTLTPIGVEYPI